MKRILFLFLALSLSFSTLAFAHGGRTDEYGGHHDYNNVSGLGDYHYHHGYEAHLHPNGQEAPFHREWPLLPESGCGPLPAYEHRILVRFS